MSITLLGSYLLIDETKVICYMVESGFYGDLLGNMKSIVSGLVQVLQCCKLLSGDKKEGACIGLSRDKSM